MDQKNPLQSGSSNMYGTNRVNSRTQFKTANNKIQKHTWQLFCWTCICTREKNNRKINLKVWLRWFMNSYQLASYITYSLRLSFKFVTYISKTFFKPLLEPSSSQNESCCKFLEIHAKILTSSRILPHNWQKIYSKTLAKSTTNPSKC